MKESVTVTLNELRKGPYPSILCYPKYDEAELQNRLEELELYGVSAVEFTGKANAFNIPVLGKGYVGVVVVAQRYGQRLALKIRRVDADRSNLLHEAEMLKRANAVDVGPELVDVSKNFLLMQLVEGDLLPTWLKSKPKPIVLRQVLGEVLEQAWRLDSIGLDHGELSKAPKHVIVDYYQQPWLVDFETSSDKRKSANVTAICQYLIMSFGPIPKAIVEIVGERDRMKIMETLREYKNNSTRENLDLLIEAVLY
ncbi:MAG: serine/threonine protein kinase [Chloroflexota bacterium]